MKYNIILASYVMGRTDLPVIPETEQSLNLDSETGLGKIIWDGYVYMNRKNIPKEVIPTSNVEYFRKAVNSFNKYLAGEGRDNWPQVKSISESRI